MVLQLCNDRISFIFIRLRSQPNVGRSGRESVGREGLIKSSPPVGRPRKNNGSSPEPVVPFNRQNRELALHRDSVSSGALDNPSPKTEN